MIQNLAGRISFLLKKNLKPLVMHISLCAAKKTNVITALQDQHGPSLISLVASWRSASRVQEKQPSCVAHLRLTAAAAFCTFPLHINCRFQLHSASLSKWLLSSSFPPSLSLFLSPVIRSRRDRSVVTVNQLEARFFRPGRPTEVVLRPSQHASSYASHETHFNGRYEHKLTLSSSSK